MVAVIMISGLFPAEAGRNQRLIDVWYRRMWNTWDKTAIAEICAPDVTFRGSLGSTVRGHAGVAAYMDQVRAAFPDFTNTVEEVISEGDKAFARLRTSSPKRSKVIGAEAPKRARNCWTTAARWPRPPRETQASPR